MEKYFKLLSKLFFALNLLINLTSIACEKNCMSSKCDLESKTFFMPRSVIEDVSLFLGLNQYNYYQHYFETDFISNEIYIEDNNNQYINNKINFNKQKLLSLEEEISLDEQNLQNLNNKLNKFQDEIKERKIKITDLEKTKKNPISEIVNPSEVVESSEKINQDLDLGLVESKEDLASDKNTLATIEKLDDKLDKVQDNSEEVKIINLENENNQAETNSQEVLQSTELILNNQNVKNIEPRKENQINNIILDTQENVQQLGDQLDKLQVSEDTNPKILLDETNKDKLDNLIQDSKESLQKLDGNLDELQDNKDEVKVIYLENSLIQTPEIKKAESKNEAKEETTETSFVEHTNNTVNTITNLIQDEQKSLNVLNYELETQKELLEQLQTTLQTKLALKKDLKEKINQLKSSKENMSIKSYESNTFNSNDPIIHIAKGVFYEQSTNNFEHSLANYFFPLTSTTSNTTSNANNAQLFESILTLDPERKIVGGYFNYHQDFSCFENLWLDVKFAIYEARHNLKPKETILSSGLIDTCTPLGFIGSNEVKFGKVSNLKLEKTGFDDIEVKLGYNYKFALCNNKGYVGLYGSCLLPIAEKATAKYLFEPLVGRGHWAAGVGLNLGYNLYKNVNKSLTLLADCSYQYLFKGKELRSLDFNVGPLSRFMSASTQDNPQVSTPAINFTTMCLDVTPRSVVNFWTALHFQACKFHSEIGYNLWFRQAEKVCFKECQKTTFDNLNLGIFDNDNFIPLKLENLDLASASHSQVFTNKVYLALSYDTNILCRDMNLGVGGSYEFTKKINALEQWGVWGNFEVKF